MPTLTTNFSLNKPVVNSATDEDLWGGYLNDNMDTIDSTLKVARDSIIRTISGSDSVVAGDRNKTLYVSASAGVATITLIAAATAGDGYQVTIKKSDSTANAVVIDGNASETIDGATTYSLASQYASVILMSDGSNWLIKAYKTTASAVASASTTAEGIIEIATAAEVIAGSSTTLAVTPGHMKTALGFSTYYESAEQSIALSSATELTHSLGSIPKFMQVEFVCKTTDVGYAAGDRISVNDLRGDSTGNMGLITGYSTTKIFITVGASLRLLNKSTGSSGAMTEANWRIVARAWA